MFEFPYIVSLYYIKNQQDATSAVLFISNCKIILHVSDAFCVHHQEYFSAQHINIISINQELMYTK